MSDELYDFLITAVSTSSSISIAMGYMLDDQDLIADGAREFSLLHRV
jgi:hypothetical protein